MSKEKRVRIPATYKISAAYTYEVFQAFNFKDGKLMGECRPSPRQIILEEGLSVEDKLSTFIHEMLHAVTNEYSNVTLTEKEVQTLEKALVYGIQNNREFWLEIIKKI